MLIPFTVVRNQAYADYNNHAWAGGADAREILIPMIAEIVYVNPQDVSVVESCSVVTGWSEDLMPERCRSVGMDQPWWIRHIGSRVRIKDVGWKVFLEEMTTVASSVNRAICSSGRAEDAIECV